MGEKADLVIAGGGFAGLGLATAVRMELGSSFEVVVVDPGLNGSPSRDPRASAIAAGPRNFFEKIGVWQRISAHAQPILDMVITDSRLDDPIRPVFLNFADDKQSGGNFGHMVENRLLIDALAARAAELGIRIEGNGSTVLRHDRAPGEICARLSTGKSISARLLVAADGGRSRLREQEGIAMHGWSYGQSGIVTTVTHERDHGGKAEEHFLPAGPFAILPLTGRRSSLVWTEKTPDADRLVALDDAAFHVELERRFGLRLGEFHVSGPRAAFPLAMRVARRFIAERMALIGDAAHLVHPIAGQGLNLGIRDTAALAECIVDSAQLGLDIGSVDTLERYQRWRRFDTVAMGLTTDILNRLFSNDLDPLRFIRDVGLGLVQRLPAARRFFAREATGLTGTVPRLMQ